MPWKLSHRRDKILAMEKIRNKRRREYLRNYNRSYYIKNREIELIRKRSKYKYGNPMECLICGVKEKLSFHHFKPYNIDNLIPVCSFHHRKLDRLYKNDLNITKED